MNIKIPPLAILHEILGRYPWLTVGLAIEFAMMVLLVNVVPERLLASPQAIGINGQLIMMFFVGTTALFGLVAPRPKTGTIGFPSRMFLLPLTTARLVAWPMLFGMAAMALSWVLMATIVFPRLGFQLPIGFGALALAAGMSWTQTLGWWPFASNVGAVLTAALVMTILLLPIAIPMIFYGAGLALGWALLPIYIVLAYAVAVRGVALDRRGEGRSGGGWRSFIERFERLFEFLASKGGSFVSAHQAQAWYEWRTKGAPLLVIASAISTFIVILNTIVTLFGTVNVDRLPLAAMGFLPTAVLISLLLCWFMGGTFGQETLGDKRLTLSPFTATRPIGSGTLASLRIRSACLFMLMTIGSTLLITLAGLVLVGRAGVLGALIRSVVEREGILWGLATGLLGSFGIAALTWKAMIGAMVPSFTGRLWISILVGSLIGLACFAAMMFGLWLAHNDQVRVWIVPMMTQAMPWTMLTILIVKGLGGLALFRVGLHRGLITRKALVACLLFATATGLSVFGLGALVIRPTNLSGWCLLAMASALAPPLGRFAAAPLALDWNRHR